MSCASASRTLGLQYINISFRKHERKKITSSALFQSFEEYSSLCVIAAFNEYLKQNKKNAELR